MDFPYGGADPCCNGGSEGAGGEGLFIGIPTSGGGDYRPPVAVAPINPQNDGVQNEVFYPVYNGGGLGSQFLLAGLLFTPDDAQIPDFDPDAFGGGGGRSTFITGGSEGGGGGPGSSDVNPGDLRALNKNELKGIDAEQFKKDIVDKAGGRFNIAKTPDGRIYLVPAQKGSGPPVATGYTLDQLRGLY